MSVPGSDKLRMRAAAMGVALTAEMADKLLKYQALMIKWNRTYNLTAIRDPEEMLDALVVLVTIKRRRVIVRIPICFCHETTRNFVGGNAFVGDCVNLHPIACRQQQRFGTTGLARDGFGCVVPCELLSRRHVRCVMA